MGWGIGNLGNNGLDNSILKNKSAIVVTAPMGSSITCSRNGRVKTAKEENGTWIFTGLDYGAGVIWTINATKDSRTTTLPIKVERFDVYYEGVFYQTMPSDIIWPTSAKKGVDYEVVQDNDTIIKPEDFNNYQNWKVRVLTTLTIQFKQAGFIDVFTVGGGGAASWTSGVGLYLGAGGNATTKKNISITTETSYPITIGAGSTEWQYWGKGGTTQGFGVSATGGDSSGETASTSQKVTPGKYEFGVSGGTKIYGKAALTNYFYHGEANTGNGGCNGAVSTSYAAYGGSGILIFRNPRG